LPTRPVCNWKLTNAVDDFIEKCFSQIPGAIDNLLMVFGRALSPSVSAELLTALTILATTPGTMLLTGGYIRPFSKLSIKEREAVLQSWLTSALPMRRKIVRAFACKSCGSVMIARLAMSAVTANTAAMGLYVIYGCSPIAIDAIGYPSPARRLLSKPLKAPSYTYTFINPPPATSSSLPTVYTDILVIGSGAGGGVVASRLAPSHKLLVIDKGIYAPTGEKSRGEAEGFNDLYQNGGFIGSESGSISVLAASVFGGGTAINWSGSLKTQHYVREEWARKKGLDWFLSDGYTQALDAVSQFLR
jgi:long-chain-alcohol oxidase